MNCPRCNQQWPDSTVLNGGCPGCLLEYVLTEAEPPPPSAAAPRTHLGPYTILDTLGRGGMGVVYRAEHGSLGRPVALKVLHPDCARQAEFPLRFQREGQLLAALAHPNIVGVYDLGCESGLYYLAMEHVRGQTLRQVLAAGPLPWAKAVTMAAQLCDALLYAHERGIIHRDIKPENVLIDTDGRVKLADFGIAKLARDGIVALTDSNAILGTRAYMAPEQLEPGKAVDHRTDIYSLAAVIYEMLTGELPLGVFAPPSQKAPVDRRVDAVLLQALDKDPAQRHASAAEFKEHLLRIGAGAARGRRTMRKLALGAAAFLLLAIGVSAALVGRFRTGDGRKVDASPPGTEASHERGQRVLTGHHARVWRVAYTRDGRLLATAGEDKMVRFWTPAGEMLGALRAYPRGELGYLSLAFSPNGKRLATAGGERTVRLWDVASQHELWALPGHNREVTDIAFSPDGSTVASASRDRTVKLREALTGKERRTLTGHSDEVLCLRYSADGKQLAAGAMNGAVKLWDPATGDELATCGHAKRVWSVAFAPNGRWLATGSHEENIKCWALGVRPLRATVLADGPEVWAVAFSPDSTMLASGSDDGVVRLWDVATGQLLRSLRGHTMQVVSVAFSPDGRQLASASWDHTAILWDLTQMGIGRR